MGFDNRDLSRRQVFEGMFRCNTDLMKMLDLVRTVAYAESTVLIDRQFPKSRLHRGRNRESTP
jgi:hypothetical protein